MSRIKRKAYRGWLLLGESVGMWTSTVARLRALSHSKRGHSSDNKGIAKRRLRWQLARSVVPCYVRGFVLLRRASYGRVVGRSSRWIRENPVRRMEWRVEGGTESPLCPLLFDPARRIGAFLLPIFLSRPSPSVTLALYSAKTRFF